MPFQLSLALSRELRLPPEPGPQAGSACCYDDQGASRPLALAGTRRFGPSLPQRNSGREGRGGVKTCVSRRPGPSSSTPHGLISRARSARVACVGLVHRRSRAVLVGHLAARRKAREILLGPGFGAYRTSVWCNPYGGAAAARYGSARSVISLATAISNLS